MIFRRTKTNTVPGPMGLPGMSARAEECGPKAAPNGKRILLVDDDPVIRRALSLKLESQGYHVVSASDGSEAIGAMRDGAPDLMLIDICFPPDVACGGGVPWDGFLIFQWLRNMGTAAAVPTIFMSGVENLEFRARAAALGGKAFFRKPFDPDQLVASIRMALNPGTAKPQGSETSPQRS